jgi:vacuolar-type H+-ATPase subunit H
MNEIAADYSLLYRSNVELKDKVNTLNESLQHYKTIEDSMQKALTLSEKTSEETINAAGDRARQITTEAEFKAESMLENARKELDDLKNEIYRLTIQRDKFKTQFATILNSELKMLDGEIVDIDLGDFSPSSSYSSGNPEGGLGGMEGGLGGAYAGASSSNFERTNQSPAFDRGALNTDPFAEAANGGGRFSRQTGGKYTNSDKSSKKESGKTSLNIKTSNNTSTKIKRGVPVPHPEPKVEDDIQQNNIPTPEPVKPAPQPVPTPEPVKPAPQPVPTPEPVKPAPQPVPTPEPVKPAPQPVPTPEPVKPAPQPVPTPEPVKPTLQTKDDFRVTQEDANNKAMKEFNETVANIQAAMRNEAEKDKEDDQAPYVGEVETRVNESNMLDSEDNHVDDGFNFFGDDDDVPTMTFDYSKKDADIHTSNFAFSNNYEDDGEALHGEVETRVKESNMLESEDSRSSGFDFIVGNDSDDVDIPTIINNF